MKGIGGIIGDICGHPYEFYNAEKREDIVLFRPEAKFTDDTVMTIAVGKWLINEKNKTRETLIPYMKECGRKYKDRGYGGMFFKWLFSDDTADYGSYGNGSAMRVGLVPFYAKNEEECLELAKITAQTTHGHEEGIKGAQAIAYATFLAREGATKKTIKKKIEEKFQYNLDKKLSEIGRAAHKFDATCQVTVPEAIICFLESTDFVSCITNCIAIGGDTDTLGAMAGPIAEAYYGIPDYLVELAKERLPEDFVRVLSAISLHSDNNVVLPFVVNKEAE